MKTVFAIFALLFAAVSAQEAPDCAVSELAKLTFIAKAGSPYLACTPLASGFTFIPIVGEPNSAQLAALCKQAPCQQTIAQIRNVSTLLDCNMVNTLRKVKLNAFRFARDFDATCASFTTAPTPAPTSLPPTTAPTAAPTPAQTTLAPTTAPAPAPTATPIPPTAVPTPTPTSESPAVSPSPSPTLMTSTPTSVPTPSPTASTAIPTTAPTPAPSTTQSIPTNEPTVLIKPSC